jgi:hypothetical protein
MPAPSNTKGAGPVKQTGVYVYGILPADVKLTEKIRGIGKGEVTLVRSGDLAALVSEVNIGQPLGTPEDFEAHQELADSAAVGSPILPLRFGAVLDSEDAVMEELLEAHRDEFTTALRELDGRTQYVVRGRYLEPAILKEILTENREAAELAEQIRGADPDAARNEQIRLGEIITSAIEAKRQEDTNAFVEAAQGSYVAGSLREPTHELDAVYIAFLVEDDQADGLRQAVDDVATEQEGRVEFGVLGPMAPWDFTGGGHEPEG